ncbi:MAG: hypothetical protein AAF629_22150 [Chloroflexota bacterium]
MKGSDKFLIGIIAGIVLLVVVAFLIVLRQPEPSYQTEETASGVAHNYLLALQQEEYARAYTYLSPSLEGYPASETAFTEQVLDEEWRFRVDTDITLSVVSEKIVGERKVVNVRETRFYRGSLFDSGQSVSTFDLKLQQEETGWKIIDADYFFAPCWRDLDQCSS